MSANVSAKGDFEFYFIVSSTLTRTIVCSLGVFGNAMSVAVWSTQVRSVRGARFLAALSVSDLAGCVFMAIYSALDFRAWILDDKNSFTARRGFGICSQMFYMLSSFLTLAVVVQRYIALTWPLHVARICSGRRQRIIIGVLVLLTFINNVPHVLMLMSIVAFVSFPDLMTLVKAQSYFSLISAFINQLLLIVFSLMLLVRLKTAFQFTTLSLEQSRIKSKKASVMVLWVAVITIIAYAGLTTSYTFYIVHFQTNGSRYEHMVAYILLTNRENLLSIAVSLNFIIYFKYCSNFRSVISKHWNECLQRCGYQKLPEVQRSLSPSLGQGAGYGSTTQETTFTDNVGN